MDEQKIADAVRRHHQEIEKRLEAAEKARDAAMKERDHQAAFEALKKEHEANGAYSEWQQGNPKGECGTALNQNRIITHNAAEAALKEAGR